MDLAQKIKLLRSKKEWTQEDLANFSGVSLQSIKWYETGKGNNITTINLKKIADAFNIEPINLLSSNMSSNIVQQTDKLSSNVSSIDEKSVVTPPNFKMSQDNISIPFFENVYASAGSGYINDENPPKTLEFSKSFIRDYLGTTEFSRLNVIKSKGDSMEPTIPKNALLFIRLGDVKEGQICVARIEDELYVKRLQKRPVIKLLSDNPDYDPITLQPDENFEIIGCVIGYIKKF
mgnify:CR=1 FL=1